MGELKPLLIPEDLREALAAEAVIEGLSLEEIAARAVEAHLRASKTRRFFEERAGRGDPKWLLEFLDRVPDATPQPPSAPVPSSSFFWRAWRPSSRTTSGPSTSAQGGSSQGALATK